jgi:hypothetical protein
MQAFGWRRIDSPPDLPSLLVIDHDIVAGATTKATERPQRYELEANVDELESIVAQARELAEKQRQERERQARKDEERARCESALKDYRDEVHAFVSAFDPLFKREHPDAPAALSRIAQALDTACAVLREAGHDQKWSRVDRQATFNRYPLSPRDLEWEKLGFEYACRLLDRGFAGRLRPEDVSNGWTEENLRNCFRMTQILLHGLVGLQVIDYRADEQPDVADTQPSPQSQAAGTLTANRTAPLAPLVGERTGRRDPSPELAKDENRERQSRYCQGFAPDWWMPALSAAKWRSLWYPREATRESVQQWSDLIDRLRVEYLGPAGMPERSADFEADKENDLALIRQYAPHLLEPEREPPAADPTPAPPKKHKRSSERGEGERKLIAALTAHHQYAKGSCLNQAPIGNNELARMAAVAPATASAFFEKHFGGHNLYEANCTDRETLIASLKLLNGEIRPHHLRLYGRTPPGEGNGSENE